MTTIASARTLLFVPAVRPDRFDRALATPADLVIVDLEASVRPVDKDAARAALVRWLAGLAGRGRVLVRVNPAMSDAFDADVQAIRESGVSGVVLPLTEAAEDVALAIDKTGGLPVIGLIETARGVMQAQAIAASGAARLAFGNMDYATDTGTRGRDSVVYACAQIVLASRAARLPPPIAGVTAAFRDASTLADEAAWERDQGFAGKLCIHPEQLAVVDRAFRPTAEELAWAKRVLASADGSFACEVDGELVDRPVVERAQRIVDACGE